jgi:hypothetical protein
MSEPSRPLPTPDAASSPRALAVLCAGIVSRSVSPNQFRVWPDLLPDGQSGIGIQTWGSLGFGFVELGTVTAQSASQ